MSDIESRVAYLRGLADGMKLDKETNEGKLLDSIIDVMGEMAEQLCDLDDEQDLIADKIDEMDEVIEIIGDQAFGVDGDYDDEDETFTVLCENCGTDILITADDLEDIASGDFDCPECGKPIEIDFSGCDCGCDCDHEH